MQENEKLENKRQRTIVWFSYGITILVFTISFALLSTILWNHGAIVSPDSVHYLGTALNIAQGQGKTMGTYAPAQDTITHSVDTHFPPSLSTVYAIGFSLGIESFLVPSIVSLVGWCLLLGGIGILTYRLSNSHLLTAMAVVFATISPFFWHVFTNAWSETLFLPLLVWLMVVLVDLPTCQQHKRTRLAIATLLLALLLLTRYTGVLVFVATCSWWVWCHVRLRHYRWLVGGLFVLAIAIVPLVIWLAGALPPPDTPQQGEMMVAPGRHFNESRHSFLDGVLAFGKEGIRILLPMLPFGRILDMNRGALVALMLIYLFLFAVAVMRIWRHHYQGFSSLLSPPRSPIPYFLLFYIALYTFLQPFLSFTPIDTRDMTSILCLLLPWGIGLLATTSQRWGNLLLGGGVLLNSSVSIIFPLLTVGLPSFIEPAIVPTVRYSTNTQVTTEHLYEPGLFNWIVVFPVHTKDLIDQHPALYAAVRQEAEEVEELVVITNETYAQIFAPYPDISVASQGLTQWLEVGHCTSRHTVLLVLFEWDYLGIDRFHPQENNQTQRVREVEQKCPNLSQRSFQHSVVYRLAPANQ